MKQLGYSVVLFFSMASLHGKTFRVTTTEDCGAGSLREAIEQVNAGVGSDTIVFDIGIGAQTIFLLSALPTIKTSHLAIDGSTQTGFSNSPLIVLDGSKAGYTSGLMLHGASKCTIKSLVINNFSRSGIELKGGSDNNSIVGCFIGTNALGMHAAPNAHHGITIIGSSKNVIGGDSQNERNVISGNGRAGINIANDLLTASNGTIIKGNYVGVNVTGNKMLPNGHAGVQINKFSISHHETAGTHVSSNIISGNAADGIFLGRQVSSTVIQHNYIGTDSTNTLNLANKGYAIRASSCEALEDTSTNIVQDNEEPQKLPSVKLETAKTLLCAGEKTTLLLTLSGQPPFTIRWLDSNAFQKITESVVYRTIQPGRTTTYTARISDVSGKTVESLPVTVRVQNRQMRLIANKNRVCAGEPVTLTATFTENPTAIHFSNGHVGHKATSPYKYTFRPQSTASYKATGHFQNKCSATSAPISVKVHPSPKVQLSQKECAHSKECTTLYATIKGGTPPFKLSWSDAPKPMTISTRSVERRVCSSKGKKYALKVVDAHQCTFVAELKTKPCNSRRSKH